MLMLGQLSIQIAGKGEIVLVNVFFFAFDPDNGEVDFAIGRGRRSSDLFHVSVSLLMRLSNRIVAKILDYFVPLSIVNLFSLFSGSPSFCSF